MSKVIFKRFFKNLLNFNKFLIIGRTIVAYPDRRIDEVYWNVYILSVYTTSRSNLLSIWLGCVFFIVRVYMINENL